jgi:hypothetical protein
MHKCPHSNCKGSLHFDEDCVGAVLTANADGNGPCHLDCPQCSQKVFLFTAEDKETLIPSTQQTH